MTKHDLVLDATGVIYDSGDDVAELLVPFIQARTRVCLQEIERNYHSASLGHISSSEFWQNVGLNDSIEDDYLSEHVLTPGFLEFLDEVRASVGSIWCLSNDVSEWSLKLRDRFGIADLFSGFVISGDVGLRKPDVRIYEKFFEMSGVDPKTTVFVDDRPNNLSAASAVGIRTVLFSASSNEKTELFPTVANFGELIKLLESGHGVMAAISIHEASEAEHPDIAAFYERCGYLRDLRAEDTILAAVRAGSLVGVVRLCSEHGVVVLRGMQVLPDFQRQGIGLGLLDKCLPRVNDAVCYCIPWSYLEQFYGSGGFERCEPGDVPGFLSERYSGYLQEGHDVILMQRIPPE